MWEKRVIIGFVMTKLGEEIWFFFLSGFLSFVFRVHPFLKKGWFMTFVVFVFISVPYGFSLT